MVFSVSLIRLIYALVVPGSPPQVLLIVSTWFVLSVGFIDGLVYVSTCITPAGNNDEELC